MTYEMIKIIVLACQITFSPSKPLDIVKAQSKCRSDLTHCYHSFLKQNNKKTWIGIGKGITPQTKMKAFKKCLTQ